MTDVENMPLNSLDLMLEMAYILPCYHSGLLHEASKNMFDVVEGKSNFNCLQTSEIVSAQ